MTENDWFIQLEKDKDKIFKIVGQYHPSIVAPPINKVDITAPNAELARRAIMHQMIREQLGNGLGKLVQALNNRDMSTCYNVMSESWFAIPESTQCWEIEGFKELVSLMENLPNEDELNEI